MIFEDLQNENAILRKQLEEYQMQLRDQQQINKQMAEAKARMRVELDSMTHYVLEMEEKVYKSNKISLELLKQLKDAELEIETLKQYIIDMK
jgi:RNA-splicing ligase RtcB